jgi:hypothetical protein
VQPLEVQEWDSEARERAMEQARKLAMRDPDAAEQLLAQLRVEEEAAKKRAPEISDAILRKVYRPSALFANMAAFYRWSWESMNNMDYVAFFVMAEEAEEIQRKRDKAMNNGKTKDIVSEQEVRGWLPSAQRYEGPTVHV